MAFRQLARQTERLDLSWPNGLEAASVVESDALRIGEFLLRAGHPLRPECEAGTLQGATFYITRLFDFHRNDQNYELALLSSTIVRDKASGRIVGMCLVGGGGAEGWEFGIYDVQVDPALQNHGIGTNMIKRSLTVLAEHGIEQFHLWREDEARAVPLYERLGFKPTGAVE
jgi:ribosomal protein S18 acetylase RimI-like enzyme